MPIDQDLTPHGEPEMTPSPEATGEAPDTSADIDVDVPSTLPEAEETTASTEPDAAPEVETPPVPEADEPGEPASQPGPVEEPIAASESEPEPTPEPEPSPEPTQQPIAAAAPANDEDLFEQAMIAMESEDSVGDIDAAYKRLSRGDRIEATVIQVDRDRVFVDLGTKAEGIVPLGELSEDPVEDATHHFKIGDKINVVVIRPEGNEGNPIVSKKRADFEKTWVRIEEAHRNGTILHAPVLERVKGGLVVDIGVRGFIPATHVGTGKLRNIDRFVGEVIDCRVIEIDRDRKKVVLSNREAAEEVRKEAKERLFREAKPGDVLDGTVRRLTDYGAFVDLGGVDGLLHISEMSWMRIQHPREMFKEGQDIQVMILRLDPDHGKISLGHRQVLPDPWNLIRETYRQGQKLTVVVSRLVQNGAFVKLPEGAEAFLPLSEMSVRRLRKPSEAVEEGQEVEVQIIDLKPDERRMVLSMRALGSSTMPQVTFDEPDREMRRVPSGGKKRKKGRKGRDEEDVEEFIAGPTRRGFSGSSGVTIGERLGMLKGFASRDEDIEDEVAEIDIEEPEEPVEAPASDNE